MKRIQFLMSDAEYENLEVLVQLAGARTKTQLMNLALDLLKWAMLEKQENRAIGSLDERTDRFKELLLPSFALTGEKVTSRISEPVSDDQESEPAAVESHTQPIPAD